MSTTPDPDVVPAPSETIRVRSVLEELPAYVAGKPAAEDGSRRFKASSNESPFPPVAAVRDAAAAGLEVTNRYPDAAAHELREALGTKHGVDPSQIALSTGSVAVTGDLVRALVDQGDEVVYPWRSFEAYPILVGSHGGVSVQVPLTAELEYDLDAMAAAVTDRTRLIILCTPNNPTGASLSTAQIEAFLGAVPEDAVVAIDEAYREFHDPATVAGTAGIFRRHGNVVLLRTFSKLQGLAGLRIGYAVAHPRLARALSQVTVPFGASIPAQTAALMSLRGDVQQELDRRAVWIREERSRVLSALAEQGWQMPSAQGNFVYFPLGEKTTEFAEFADRRGLVLRAYGTDGVRATIAEQEANDLLIEVARAWRERRPA
ncbi:aminotransferase class I/II-fold pyridoxal phosphate-dependent enzyme [Brachybacterium sp. JB7]|uniref:histidinol-phosphate transaminase n=1 Tax=Brachybacterium TaxID=43668 RepID=UPI000BB8D03B|nr:MULTISPECIES: histidinol-phosphate transaminase [Brachybacterium]PCC33016.1 aminotransferase [Brachybacterium alimentarium]RCS61042.1 aminotransferase class I/II-fold pyridoxal phosphate-dependent enzyme [Brachybacterium sp. JB7]RCS67606.1 aminotransferase class I/II-fold pyridoxal phosphate-dependent enzyme [Brachybacterium alimentarium]RCS76829.1 aminotransferase class I/II-fold pyridoxal phosphate-dependent enzyme [Brachybacterium alimentarium]